ncbi:hypothetical protein ACWDNI_35775 [Nocardia niigatensis]
MGSNEPRDLIAEGRRLLAEAGPYRWIVGGTSPSGVQYVGCVVADDEPPELLGDIAYAEHIVHMHNTFGELLDRLEQANTRIAELEKRNAMLRKNYDYASRRLTELLEERAALAASPLGQALESPLLRPASTLDTVAEAQGEWTRER